MYLILLHEKFLQFDWLRAVVFQLNLKYLHVKITNLSSQISRITILKYHSWYLCQISLLIMLLPILITLNSGHTLIKRFENPYLAAF